jgi:hypothetical protein
VFWLIVAHADARGLVFSFVGMGVIVAMTAAFAGWLVFPDGSRVVRACRAVMAVGAVALVIVAFVYGLLVAGG